MHFSIMLYSDVAPLGQLLYLKSCVALNPLCCHYSEDRKICFSWLLNNLSKYRTVYKYWMYNRVIKLLLTFTFYRWFKSPSSGGLFATTVVRKATFLQTFWNRWGATGLWKIPRWANRHLLLLWVTADATCDILFPLFSPAVEFSWASYSGHELQTCWSQSLAGVQRFLQTVSKQRDNWRIPVLLDPVIWC